MPAQLSFDPARTAVLSMDLQAGIVSIYVKDQGRLFPAQAQILAAQRIPRSSRLTDVFPMLSGDVFAHSVSISNHAIFMIGSACYGNT